MRLLETDSLSNQNISSTLLVGTYTADAARSVFVRLFADQVAGTGSYEPYVTIQRAGAGSAYRYIPAVSAYAAAGVTAICMSTVAVPLANTDVLKVYLTGLVGDTTTPDIVVEFWEDDTLRPTTADRTLDVAATGEAGLDFDNVKVATGATTLTNITVPVVTSVTNGVGLADDAITSAKFDESSAYPLKAADTGATQIARVGADSDTLETLSDQIDLSALATELAKVPKSDAAVTWNATALASINAEVDTALNTTIPALPTANSINERVAAIDDLTQASGGGDLAAILVDTGTTLDTLIKDVPTNTELATALGTADDATLAAIATVDDAVWAYATRTLTQTAAQVAAVMAGSTITIHRGDSLSATLTGLGNISTRTKLWFTVKDAYGVSDGLALIQIEETAGLVYLNGAAGTPANGDITVDNATLGNITITLTAASTAALTPVSGLAYDVQMLTASGVTTLAAGTCNVSADVTRAVA